MVYDSSEFVWPTETAHGKRCKAEHSVMFHFYLRLAPAVNRREMGELRPSSLRQDRDRSHDSLSTDRVASQSTTYAVLGMLQLGAQTGFAASSGIIHSVVALVAGAQTPGS